MGIMDFFHKGSNPAQAYDQYQSTEHKSSLSHEAIAAAAAFEGAKAYEKHVAKNGKPQSHDEAKAIFAAGAAAFIDREAETKGLDFIDKEKTKREATNHFSNDVYNQY
ncbi:hypothetical protein BOTBODRAFT_55064 [Botryobasidium botryosum FD-172 SS1]|uniref:Uncharacterized protein n=1 Tax=Botryobasidium botryosum (strain FD-172 SS1) TaxID=930990 RepID=A0A067MJJ0_BOTB1|nr:hypothetical protein BOTBODRAFT_55064 [Botryobasidium botryosum FD-172 SS1]